MKSARSLLICGVPGLLGGAATKIRHAALLLKDVAEILFVFTEREQIRIPHVAEFLKKHGLTWRFIKDLPEKCEGTVLVICELNFFSGGHAEALKRRGLKIVFSNEMMWEFKGEAEAVRKGLVDKVLFVSDFQAAKFADLYRGVPAAIPGNYVAPEDFEFVERKSPEFTIGRLSRPDPDKYPEDFPVFYEELGLPEVKYRVMAWDDALRKKYRWHRFGPEWELLKPMQEPTDKFLQGLDLFVYPLGHLFKESWGRSTVEAMLTGAIPLVPAGHQFHNLIVHGESGFICGSFGEYRDVARELQRDHGLRRRLSRQCAKHARTTICNPEEHRRIWMDALAV